MNPILKQKKKKVIRKLMSRLNFIKKNIHTQLAVRSDIILRNSLRKLKKLQQQEHKEGKKAILA